MVIESLIKSIENSKLGIFELNDKFQIHTARLSTDKKGYNIYFKKRNEDGEYDIYDEFDEENIFTDYSTYISKEDLKKEPNIEFYTEKFEKANRRKIMADRNAIISYSEYSTDEIIKIKTLINSLENGYADVAFSIYFAELKSHNLRRYYNISRKTKGIDGGFNNAKYTVFDQYGNRGKDETINPLYPDLFNGIKIAGKTTKYEKELFLCNDSLREHYLSKVRNALNIRQNPNGTIHTDFVIRAVLRIANAKKSNKKIKQKNIRSLFVNRDDEEKERFTKIKQVFDDLEI